MEFDGSVPDYNQFRLSALDANNAGSATGVIALLTVQSDILKYVYGQLSLLGEPNMYSGSDADVLYSAETGASIEVIMSICNEVANCIQTSIDVQNAIVQLLRELNIPNNSPNAPMNIETKNVLTPNDCNYDDVYGSAVALVDFIASNAESFLAQILDELNDNRRYFSLLASVPVIGNMLDEITPDEIVDWIITAGQTAWDAGYTPALRQELICDIFALGCADCNIPVNEVTGVFIEKLAWDITQTEPVREYIYNMITETQTEQAFVLALMGFVCATLTAGGEFMGLIGAESLIAVARSGDADSDWQLFCDDCASGIYVTFDNGTYADYQILFDGGTVLGTAGINGSSALRRSQNSGAGGAVNKCHIRVNLPAPSIVVNLSFQAFTSKTTWFKWIQFFDSNGTLLHDIQETVNAVPNQYALISHSVNVLNCSYVTIWNGNNLPNTFLDNRLDNIQISVQ